LQLAHLYAGFANRLLGENMCGATIDGGPELPYTEFLDRAEASFTSAIGITGGTAATIANQANAARAGRAAVRVHLDDWTGATADAATLAADYVYNMPYFSVGEDDQRNRIFWSSGNSRESGSAYRAHTQWNTWHYDYRNATNDPRVPIAITTLLGDAAIECCGRVPFYPEAKYTSSASPIRLTSGREMLLIQAEERLRANDMVGGMAFINQTRTAAGVSGGPLVATDLNDAWRLLKRERGIELWLEGRRLGDLRRWDAAGTPGALDPLESVGPTVSHLAQQDLCFPISKDERETNPNF
jgi:starch-binding outer membrane protein, SusD/RagB family